MGTGHHPWARKGKEHRPRRRERGHNDGHQSPHAGRACHDGETNSAPPPADTAQPPEAHAPNIRRQNTNLTPNRPHQLTPTCHEKPDRGKRAHLHGDKGLHPQRKPPRTPPSSPPPRPHRQAKTPATARATSQAAEEEEGAATAPRSREQDPKRTRDHSTGPQGGKPRGHLTDPPARAAHQDPHITDQTSDPAPNRTPRPPATPTRTPHHDTGRTDLHEPTRAQHGEARHTAPQRTTVQHTRTRHSKAQHATA